MNNDGDASDATVSSFLWISNLFEGDGRGDADVVSLSDLRTLEDFVEHYKGVDGSPSASKTVLFSLTTMNQANLTLNWACWTRGLGLSFFVWATDKEVQEYLTDRGIPAYFDEDTHDSANARNVKYNISREHNLWTRSGFEKMHAVMRIMDLGYDVFLSDVDIAVVRNPWPHFKLDADIEYQADMRMMEEDITKFTVYNTGFFVAKNNAKTRALFNETIHRPRVHHSVDQEVFNQILWAKNKEDSTIWLNYTEPVRLGEWALGQEEKLVMRMLPFLEFPSGGIAFNGVRRDRYLAKLVAEGVDPVMAHFNQMQWTRIKELCMHQKGYWRYDEALNTCASEYEIDYTEKKGCKIKEDQ